MGMGMGVGMGMSMGMDISRAIQEHVHEVGNRNHHNQHYRHMNLNRNRDRYNASTSASASAARAVRNIRSGIGMASLGIDRDMGMTRDMRMDRDIGRNPSVHTNSSNGPGRNGAGFRMEEEDMTMPGLLSRLATVRDLSTRSSLRGAGVGAGSGGPSSSRHLASSIGFQTSTLRSGTDEGSDEGLTSVTTSAAISTPAATAGSVRGTCARTVDTRTTTHIPSATTATSGATSGTSANATSIGGELTWDTEHSHWHTDHSHLERIQREAEDTARREYLNAHRHAQQFADSLWEDDGDDYDDIIGISDEDDAIEDDDIAAIINDVELENQQASSMPDGIPTVAHSLFHQEQHHLHQLHTPYQFSPDNEGSGNGENAAQNPSTARNGNGNDNRGISSRTTAHARSRRNARSQSRDMVREIISLLDDSSDEDEDDDEVEEVIIQEDALVMRTRAAVATKKAEASSSSSSSLKVDTTADENCCICLERPKPRELSKLDGCNHLYCFHCIEKWSQRENTCPQCKTRFTKIERVHKLKRKAGARDSGSGGDNGSENTRNVKKVKNRDQRADLMQQNPLHSILTHMEAHGLNFLFRAGGPNGILDGQDSIFFGLNGGVGSRGPRERASASTSTGVGAASASVNLFPFLSRASGATAASSSSTTASSAGNSIAASIGSSLGLLSANGGMPRQFLSYPSSTRTSRSSGIPYTLGQTRAEHNEARNGTNSSLNSNSLLRNSQPPRTTRMRVSQYINRRDNHSNNNPLSTPTSTLTQPPAVSTSRARARDGRALSPPVGNSDLAFASLERAGTFGGSNSSNRPFHSNNTSDGIGNGNGNDNGSRGLDSNGGMGSTTGGASNTLTSADFLPPVTRWRAAPSSVSGSVSQSARRRRRALRRAASATRHRSYVEGSGRDNVLEIIDSSDEEN
uniref:RING-type domain-containing protein n=1 Tax=Chaetoceros debilis TaxID=122233 RepID=A0A7S3VED5_9STRA